MPEITPTKYLVTATWDDAPHLTEAQKQELWESIPPHQRDARAKGIPQLGSGAIYPVVEERIKQEPFEIPSFWPHAYAMDVGWKATACLWGAWDRQSDTVFVWSEYKQGHAEPATHVDAIKSRGWWIPGVIDPAANGRGQRDGIKLFDEYVGMGLDLKPAENAVESGIHAVYRRLVSGRLKIFSNCIALFDEYRLYRRDDKGKVVKDNDHLMDCLRYLIVSGMGVALNEHQATDRDNNDHYQWVSSGNRTTGY